MKCRFEAAADAPGKPRPGDSAYRCIACDFRLWSLQPAHRIPRACRAAVPGRAPTGPPGPIVPPITRLLRAIDEMVSNGIATRPQEEIGQCLAKCQKCRRWTDPGCARFTATKCKTLLDFLNFLTQAQNHCPQWD